MKLERYINSGRIRSLHSVLSSWIDIVQRYVSYFDNTDNPWWYNERATLSSLAAAAWAADYIALEEYSTQKGKRKDQWKGRCDLFMAIGGEYFACESKQVWCAVSLRAKSGHATVQSGLDAACANARELNRDEGRRLGICFAVPRVPSSDDQKMELLIEKWLKKIINIEYSSIAWVFPKKARRHMSEKGYFYPGLVLMAKEVFRQS